MNTLAEIDFTDPNTLLGLTLLLGVIIFLRYLFISGAYHYLFFILLRKKYDRRFLNHKKLSGKQLWKETGLSAISAVIFALIGVGMLILWQKGYTQIYEGWLDYPVWYIPISIFLALFLQDTYYYWIHRWMHRPKVLRFFHMAHHNSIHTSVLTSFSFHPLESVIQAAMFPVILLFLPMHMYVVLFVLVIMTLSATINHGGVEIFPPGWKKSKLAGWLIGATHHDLHHKQFRYNFGLYFTFWDKLMGTESPKYRQD